MCVDVDTTLDKLPLRKRDGARVMDTSRNIYKSYGEESQTVYLQRYISGAVVGITCTCMY